MGFNYKSNDILGKNFLKVHKIRSGAKQGCPLSTLLFSIALEVLARSIR